ncbi:glycoside hydrolase family 127 protein [Bacteroidia bacterium]|nr:glycoside hydrolase family 127 protein [Bacteroidia bacterium]
MSIKKKINYWRNYLLYSRYKNKYPGLGSNSAGQHDNLDLALNWILNTHKASKDKGVPAVYHLSSAIYLQSYRETTGYIICTLLDLHQKSADPLLIKHAIEMADWELSVQDPSGGFGEIHPDGKEVLKVFNTGQIIFGLCDIYQQTKDRKYLAAAQKAGDWLCEIQEADGTWQQHTTLGPKSYHSRVAWSLLELDACEPNKLYMEKAKANLDWVLSCYQANNYISNTSLNYKSPWTHLIAYTIRGLYESAQLLNDNHMEAKAIATLDEIIKTHSGSHNPLVNGTFNANWQGDANYSCLTGNAQLAIIAYRYYAKSKNAIYRQFADGQMELLNQIQIKTGPATVKGGITGSMPVYGDYCPHQIPNWAVKFYIDALLLQEQCNAI